MRKSYKEKKKSLITFLLLFYDQTYGKILLFCCKGSSHAIFTFFYVSQVKYLRKAFTKKKYKKSANDFFIFVLILFYDLKYLNSTKSRLSNQKSGID